MLVGYWLITFSVVMLHLNRKLNSHSSADPAHFCECEIFCQIQGNCFKAILAMVCLSINCYMNT